MQCIHGHETAMIEHAEHKLSSAYLNYTFDTTPLIKLCFFWEAHTSFVFIPF